MHVGLALSGAARDTLAAALIAAGFEVHTAANLERVRTLQDRGAVDAWVFDARFEELLEGLLESGRFLLPADNIPERGDARAFSLWADALVAQLSIALAARSTGRSFDRWGEVRGVWLLAGSAGATGAVQQFLNALRAPPPVAFLYAQHLEPTHDYMLHGFTPENPQFSLCKSESVHALEPGRLIMISPRYTVALNEFGQLTSTRQAWSGPHTPDIDELLVILAAAQLPSPGVIIFSGMGSDGAEGLRVFEAVGGRVWVQSPSSAVCSAMPQAALDSGFAHRSGDPASLAGALEALYAR